MIGATFCSGIGAPELAAPWVDWRFASEVAPFPRNVLQQRFGYVVPEDHNQGDPLLWGDMSEVTPDLMRARGIPLPDLIVAGTPCQAFSVAGARKGLADKRGNLTLTFVEILHAIVAARPDGKLAVLWENVPGVLSDEGNAFGCFLGGLVGAVDALAAPADGSWPSEGMVEGPRARAAWAVLDAQWFGVAQRRRRVFVVVDFGNCVDPAAVLLEPDSLRGNTPPRREAGQAAPSIPPRSTGGGGLGADFDCDGGLIPSVSMCLNAGAMGRIDGESETFIPEIAGTMKACATSGGFSNSADHAAAGYMIPVSVAMRGREDGAQMEVGDDCAFTLRASEGGGDKPHVFAPVAFDCKGTQVQFSTDGTHPTLRSMGHADSHANAGGHAAIAFDRYNQTVTGDVAQTLCSRGDTEGGAAHLAPHLALPWAVRRLIPKECSRLQGFPPDHTAITVRGKPAADGNQYKAIGNSMAVPVISWILERMRISMEAAA